MTVTVNTPTGTGVVTSDLERGEILASGQEDCIVRLLDTGETRHLSYDDLSLAAETPFRIVTGKYESGELGEYYTHYAVWEVPKDWDHEKISAWVISHFPSEHCQHSYDCCGHFYPGAASWSLVNGGGYGATHREILIRRGYSQNI